MEMKKICPSELVLAAQKGDIEEIKKQYEAVSALPKKKDKFYFALYFASFNGKEDIVKFLLANKVNPNHVVGSYLTPLYAAILKKHNNIVEMLLNHGANVNPKMKIKSGKKTVEINYFCSPLICAAHTQNEKVIEMLLPKGAVVNVKLQSVDPGKWKQPKNSEKIKQEDEYENCLNFGTFSSYDLREEYKERGEIGFTPLHFVIRVNTINSAQLLLDYGADVNARSKNDLTPLCLACERNDVELVKILLKSGADMKAQVNNGKHLLCYIIDRVVHKSFQLSYDDLTKETWIEWSKVFSYLLKIGADPNGWSIKNRESVLHCAARSGVSHIVHILLKHNANVNSVDGEFKTPIEYAVDHLKDVLNSIQDEYSIIPDSSSDDDYRNDYDDSDEEDYHQQEMESRRKEREESRKRQFEKRKIYNLTHNTYTYNVYQYKYDHNHDNGFTVFQDPNPFRQIAQLLTRELVRLEVLGKRNVEQNVKLLQTTFVKPYYTRCKNELKKLKKNAIADGVNYYDFLFASDIKLNEYMKNENIANGINEETCRKLFPNYCRFLKLKVKRGLKRKLSDGDEESDGSSDEDLAKGSVQMRGRAKKRRYYYGAPGELCVLS